MGNENLQENINNEDKNIIVNENCQENNNNDINMMRMEN